MKTICIILCAVCALFAAMPLHALECTPVSTALKLDGKLDDAAWAAAPWQADFATIGVEPKTPREATRFKVLRDAQGLWIGVECEDARIKAIERPRDSGTWIDDCVEIFISPHALITPDPNCQDYYQFIVNAVGSIFDGYSVGGSMDDSWECRFLAATARTETGWSLELFLPFSAFQSDNEDTWHLLVARENIYDEQGNREIVSSPQVPYLATTEKYAPLTGLNIDKSRFGNTLESMALDARMGDDGMECFVAGKLTTLFAGDAELKCQILDGEGKEAAVATQRLTLATKAPTGFFIPVTLTKSGTYKVWLELLDEQGMVFQQVTVAELDLSPLKVTLRWPLRNTLLASMTNRFAVFEVKSKLPPNVPIWLEAKDENNTQLVDPQQLRNSIGDGRLQVSVPLNQVASGKVTVTFRLRRQNETVATAEKTITVLPPQKGTEAYVDTRRQVVINGRPTFLRGFYGCSLANPDEGREIPLLRKAGCNVAHSYVLNTEDLDTVRQRLDWARQGGLWVMLYPYPHMSATTAGLKVGEKTYLTLTEDVRTHIIDFVNALKDHPALLGWFLFDEPRNAEYARTLKEINELLHEIDPAHLTFGNDNDGTGCVKLRDCADVLMPDIYPGPVKGSDVVRTSIGAIYNQVFDVTRKCPDNAVCFTPQSFDYDSFAERPNSHRGPTFRETRATVFATIAAGSRAGMIPYKIGNPEVKYGQQHANSGIFCSPEMKLGFLEGVMPEMAALEAVLLAPDAPFPAVCSLKEVKLASRTFAHDGQKYTCVFSTNVLPKDLGEAIIIWPNENPVRLLSEAIPLKQNGREIRLPYGKYAVHILTDDPTLVSTISVEALEAQIALETESMKKSTE